MKAKIKYTELISSLFVWKGWGQTATRPCLKCRRATTGLVKDVRDGRRAALCLECAKRRGLT